METIALDALMARIPTLGQEDMRVLHAAWEGGHGDLRQRAWKDGKRILAERDLEETYRVASDLVRRWVNDARSVSARSTAMVFGTIPSFIEQDVLDLRIAAAPALLDAVLASLVGDVLDPEELDELMAPWLEAVERPAPIADAWATTDG